MGFVSVGRHGATIAPLRGKSAPLVGVTCFDELFEDQIKALFDQVGLADVVDNEVNACSKFAIITIVDFSHDGDRRSRFDTQPPSRDGGSWVLTNSGLGTSRHRLTFDQV